jgi:DNA polymerase I-like protein with 3'-5' exonuclease and polymerase domains
MYQCNIQGFHSVKLVNLVHDEIVCEVPEKEAEEVGKLLKESMEFAGSLILKKVPVVADVVISDKWEK